MKLKLHTQIILAIILGAIFGIIFPNSLHLTAPIGTIFIRLLKMIIVPLVLASIVMGVVSLGDIRHVGKLGIRTFGLFMLTTLLSASIGLFLGHTLTPGLDANMGQVATLSQDIAPPTVSQILIDIVPKNIFQAFSESKMLSVIFFALLMGLALTAIGERGKPLLQFIDGLNSLMMKITDWVMAIAPIGVFALMASMIAKTGLKAFASLALYMICVVIGLFIHAFITLPSLLMVLSGFSPVVLARQLFTALATAFSTSSSAATLPITMDSLIKRTKVSSRITSFIIPLGTTINMDGTALYQAVATIFIAQVYGINISFSQMVIIALMTTLASIGAAAIPSAGIITMAMILRSVNVPIEGIGLIFAVDRLLDMCRTTVNVWGNACVTVIMATFE